MTLLLRSLAVACAALLLAPPAGAKKTKKSKPPAVALFLVEKNKPDVATMMAALSAIEALGTRASMSLLSGAKLKKALKKDPATAIVGCGPNFACIAKLGKKLNASEVIYGRASPSEGGVQIQFVVIGVNSKALERRVAVDIASADAAPAALEARFTEIFGTSLPPPAEAAPAVAAAPAKSDAGGEVLEFGGSAEAPPEEPVLAGIAPAGEKSDAAAPAVLEPAAEQTAAAPVEPTPAPMPSTSAEAPSGGGSSWLLYSGIAGAGAGAVLAGLGGMFGMQSKSAQGSIHDRTALPKAVDLEDEANAKARQANLFFAAGAGLLAIGGTLIGIAAASGDPPSTSVTVGEGGASAAFSFSW